MGRAYPTRINCVFKKKSGQIVLDQIRTIDKARVVKKLGTLDPTTAAKTLGILAEVFAP